MMQTSIPTGPTGAIGRFAQPTSTYDPVASRLDVSPYVGVTRRVLRTAQKLAEYVPPGATWTRGVVTMSDGTRTKTYECQFASSARPEEPLLVRPLCRHDACTFERLFGFGCHCDGFSTERTIAIADDGRFRVESRAA